MTKKLKWRLTKLPTVEELQALVQDKTITKDEARDILFTQEDETERDTKSLQSEIKFLRELVERLSKGSSPTIIETIKYVEGPYHNYKWYRPYETWCGSGTITLRDATVGSTSNLISSAGADTVLTQTSSFSEVKTF